MKIDEEFAELIPPLSEEEYKGLETSILKEGCRDALVVWNDTLIDGHNRYSVCEAHGLPYKTVQRDFADRNAAMMWILQNQLSRRNLNDFQRVEMVRKCEHAVKSQAQQRMLSGKSDPSLKWDKGRATEELGAMAGVSRNTYERAAAIIEKAPEAVTQAVRVKQLSINAGYEVTKLKAEDQEEISTRINEGEKAKDVVSEVRARSGVSAKIYDRAVAVIETAPEEMKAELRRGNLTISQAYTQIKRAETEAKREEARQKNAEKVQALSNPLEGQGLYQTIVIDPAWDWEDEGDVSQFGRAKPDYHTMRIEEIEALPIAKIADENCHLYI